MQITVTKPADVEAKVLHIEFPLRYLDDPDSPQRDWPEAPEGVPGRHGDRYWLGIDVDSGKVIDWPEGQTVELYEKVADEGTYELFAADGTSIHRVHEGYVPGVLPGDHYGDYIIINIEGDGTISNWPGGHIGWKSIQKRLTEWVTE